MKHIIFVAGLLLLLFASSSSILQAQSPWIAPRGEVSVNPVYVFETFDEYYFGSGKEDLDLGDVDHHHFLLGLEYVALEDLALDFTFGYVRALSSAHEVNDGWADTTFGARYRILDEQDEKHPFYVPTLTVRLGGIIEGSYYTDQIEAPGKGASGFEGSILVGKILGKTGVHVYGDLGYRVHGNTVPDDFFLGIGASYRFLESLIASLNFRHIQSLSGTNVDEDGFQPHKFNERKEIADTLELGLGYETPGARYFGIRVGKTLVGKNTPSKLTMGISMVLPF